MLKLLLKSPVVWLSDVSSAQDITSAAGVVCDDVANPQSKLSKFGTYPRGSVKRKDFFTPHVSVPYSIFL